MTILEIIAAWLYATMMSAEGLFRELNMLRCHNCGCRHRRSINHRYTEPTASSGRVLNEFEEACAKCGYVMNAWFRGAYACPTTYSELAGLRWFILKHDVKRFFQRRVSK